jgi:hypothetical protein
MELGVVEGARVEDGVKVAIGGIGVAVGVEAGVDVTPGVEGVAHPVIISRNSTRENVLEGFLTIYPPGIVGYLLR